MVGVWVLDIEQITEFCKDFVTKQKNFQNAYCCNCFQKLPGFLICTFCKTIQMMKKLS